MSGGCGSGEVDQANQRGIEAMQRGEFAKAAEAFSAAVKSQPKVPGGYRNRGDAYYSMHGSDPSSLAKAIADYTTAIELEPTERELSLLYQRRGRAYVASNRPDVAEQDLSKAIKILSTDAETYLLRADCRVKLRNADGAAEDLRQVQSLAPPNPMMLMKLAEAYATIGYLEDALGAIDKFLATAEPNKRHFGHRLRGAVFFQQRKYDEAITEYSRVIEQQPNDAQAFYDRGFAFLQQGKHDTAIEDFNKVIATDSKNLYAYLQRAVCRDKKDDRAGAIEDLSIFIEKVPKLSGPYLHRGRLYTEAGDHERAIADFTTSIEIQPSAAAFRARSKAYKAAGEDEKAGEDEAEAKRLEAK